MLAEIQATDKRVRLSEIKNEVDEFHPLLLNLLIKLPRVGDVKSTHGNQEWGADFIVTRKDDLTESEEYIGVIVKIGKIHQDLSKIEQQIDECDEERIGPDSKKRIRLDEIWIITNETITQGAQQNIFRKFSTRKIKFYQSKDLVKLIDKYLPNFWYEIPIKIGEYFQSLVNYLDRKELDSNLLNIPNSVLYIDQNIVESEWHHNFRKRDSRKHIDIFNEISSNTIIFIEGEAGFGKSKLLRHIARHFCNPIQYKNERFVPVILSYKEIVEKFDSNIYNALEDRIGSYKIHLEQDSSLLFLIDGVDEKSLDNEKQIATIDSIVASVCNIQNAKAVFATRPIGFMEGENKFSCPVKKLEIKPLNFSKVLKFFDSLCKSTGISSRIVEDLKKSQLFKDLPKSPIATILLANLIHENSQDLPSNLTELYSKYLELMLGRWDIIDKGLQSQKEYEAAKSIIIDISNYFIENSLDCISIEEAKNFFCEFLSKRNLKISPIDLFEKVVKRSGIISINHEKGLLFFKHRTFCEYFFSLGKYKSGSDEFIDNKIYNYYWRNIYFFYIGLKKDCELTLKRLLSIKPEADVERLIRIINSSDFMLAAYASPYSIVNDYLPKLFLEASALYMDINQDKIDTPLKNLTSVQLLWFFQAVMRHHYGYAFFKEALEDAILTIDGDESIDKDCRLNALFFAGATAAELGLNDPFDFLISEHKDDIPLLLGIGLHYESKRLKNITTNMKNFNKKITNQLKKSPSLKSLVRDFHDKTVSDKIFLKK